MIRELESWAKKAFGKAETALKLGIQDNQS